MKKINAVLFSMLTTSCLLVVFGISIAYATFVEKNYGTPTAQILIYSARWFEVLLALLGVNLIGSLFFYRSFKLKRWSMVLFHLAFIIMLVGAGLTRFFSYEGSMHIREGESSNQLMSTDRYFSIDAVGQQADTVFAEWKTSFSPYTNHDFSRTLEAEGNKLELEVEEFVPGGVQKLVPDERGVPAIELLVVERGEQKNVVLFPNQTLWFADFSIAFENLSTGADIQLRRNGPGLVIEAKDTINLFSMAGDTVSSYLPRMENPFSGKYIYRQHESVFMLREYMPQSRLTLTSEQAEQMARPDALLVNLNWNGESCQTVVYGKKGMVSGSVRMSLADMQITLNYGAKLMELPFSLKLNDFQLERYPGSMSPSSFASEVTLIDKMENIERPYRIYMNNILDYAGYRFFQSSYDEDEKGTILSVNYDSMGTMVTYLGYLLMSLGMIFSFFNKNSRFQFLLRSASRIKALKKKNVVVLLFGVLLLPVTSSAQSEALHIENNHLKKLDRLLVQDRKGRIEPLNTLASEVLRKLTKKNTFRGLSATEVFAGMSAMPEAWKNERLIRISNSQLVAELGFSGDYVSFNQLVDLSKGIYRLRNQVDEAYQKKPNERNKYDKEVISVDERVNICYQVFNHDFLTVFPDVSDKNQTWHTEKDYYRGSRTNPKQEDLLMSNYLHELQLAMLTSDFSLADNRLLQMVNFQSEHGSSLILSDRKISMEILYNDFNVFGWLSKIGAVCGLLLLIVHLLTIFKTHRRLSGILVVGNWIVFALFVSYTLGLSVRWYISGHAPWSNSYETLLYVGWATFLSGFVFIRKSQITLAVTTILTSLILMVAGMSWLNPEITNLVPVLKSYWLIVHVAVITASYGFLGIAALLGILNLVLMICRNSKNYLHLSYTIVELAVVIELSLIVGLVLLTIGAFIGGVWANESWGRYWGWDPKETWALVTILVYSFIIHLRKIPGVYSHYLLSSLAMLGISSVLMTFFGVNYYLSGMHSYGQGEHPSVPSAIYWCIAIALCLVILAGIKERKYGQINGLDEQELEDK